MTKTTDQPICDQLSHKILGSEGRPLACVSDSDCKTFRGLAELLVEGDAKEHLNRKRICVNDEQFFDLERDKTAKCVKRFPLWPWNPCDATKKPSLQRCPQTTTTACFTEKGAACPWDRDMVELDARHRTYCSLDLEDDKKICVNKGYFVGGGIAQK
jgi:hypothetical protein